MANELPFIEAVLPLHILMVGAYMVNVVHSPNKWLPLIAPSAALCLLISDIYLGPSSKIIMPGTIDKITVLVPIVYPHLFLLIMMGAANCVINISPADSKPFPNKTALLIVFLGGFWTFLLYSAA